MSLRFRCLEAGRLGFISLSIPRRLGDKEWMVRPSSSTAEARSHGENLETCDNENGKVFPGRLGFSVTPRRRGQKTELPER